MIPSLAGHGTQMVGPSSWAVWTLPVELPSIFPLVPPLSLFPSTLVNAVAMAQRDSLTSPIILLMSSSEPFSSGSDGLASTVALPFPPT